MESENTEYTLDELAGISGVSQRTIRYYQGEKLLPKPVKRGRTAIYDDEHVRRLVQIGELSDRGLKLDMIRALVNSDDAGETIGEWLGVDATLSMPWSSDRPETATHERLLEILAEHGDAPPGLIGELARHGYVTNAPENTWTIASPTLLRVALRLRSAGTDIAVTAKVHQLFRQRIARAVDDAVRLLTDRAGDGFAASGSAQDIAIAIDVLRPAAHDSVSALLANEVERSLGTLLETGPGARR